MSGQLTRLQKVQVDLGEEPDDKWGPLCRAALEKEIAASVARRAGKAEGSEPEGGGRKAEGGMSWPREAEAAAFYGKSDGSSKWEAANLVTFEPAYALFMDGQLVRKVRCHRLVQASLSRILSAIRDLYKTPEAIRAVGLDQYDGCYNFRPVRGASRLSMHAYGAAIDFDAAHNALGSTHGRMPPEVVAIFKAEGWRWGGDYSGRKDWMHFEACR